MSKNTSIDDLPPSWRKHVKSIRFENGKFRTENLWLRDRVEELEAEIAALRGES